MIQKLRALFSSAPPPHLTNYRELDRRKCDYHLQAGDTFELTFRHEDGRVDVLYKREFTEALVVVEAVAFEVDDNGRKSIGGYFVSSKTCDNPRCMCSLK